MKDVKVLIVDDEESLVFTLKDIFNDYKVDTCVRSMDALEIIKSGAKYDIFLIDFRMPGLSGLDLLYEIKKHHTSYKAILITAYSNKEILEKGINNELFHRVVNKPFEPEELLIIVRDAIRLLHKEREQKESSAMIDQQIACLVNTFGQTKSIIIHSCQKMRDLIATTRKFGRSNANVLIEGESGTGKELFANLIHSEGTRADKPMIKLNCSAIPEHLFESELFGYKKGAFTGAMSDKPGKFQMANGGILFLDEIGELPLGQQAKLLRAIEDFEISPLGSTETEHVDVRIVCATNKDLDEMVNKGTFRGDLRFRLNILNLHIPSLKDWRQDIPLLATYFLADIANREGRITKRMDLEAIELLTALEFPGNVRELKNFIYRIYINTEDSIIRKTDIEAFKSGSAPKKDSLFNESLTLVEMEREYIHVQLKKHDFSLTDVSKILGIEISNLSRKLKNMGISVKDLRKSVA